VKFEAGNRPGSMRPPWSREYQVRAQHLGVEGRHVAGSLIESPNLLARAKMKARVGLPECSLPTSGVGVRSRILGALLFGLGAARIVRRPRVRSWCGRRLLLAAHLPRTREQSLNDRDL